MPCLRSIYSFGISLRVKEIVFITLKKYYLNNPFLLKTKTKTKT